MLKKVYLNRKPRVGDIVEAISNPFNHGDQIVGYEYEVLKLSHGYIVVTGDRMPAAKSELIIRDGCYQVIDYRPVQKPKEKHVKVYKFLGIPVGKRIVYVYDNK